MISVEQLNWYFKYIQLAIEWLDEAAMIDIAHLSDIHFGNDFSQATWNSVVNAVIGFDPHLIVVSGDLVDHPSPEHLLAAKGALRYLLEKTHANSNAVRKGKATTMSLSLASPSARNGSIGSNGYFTATPIRPKRYCSANSTLTTSVSIRFFSALRPARSRKMPGGGAE